MAKSSIPVATLKRLPLYLGYVKSIDTQTKYTVSSKEISRALQCNEIQVRKDLAMVSNRGKPKIGYRVDELTADLENYLGYRDTNEALIVGVGKLGRALMEYNGFAEYGLKIPIAFDIDPLVIDEEQHIFPLDKLKDLCSRLHIQIAIVTVPAQCAQEVCDLVIASGVRAVWNFAPIPVQGPEGIWIQNENMASSLAIIAKQLKK